MAIDVFVADEQSARPVDCERWAALAESVLRAEKVRGEAELSVLFVDESAIASLNARFLGHDGPTDVLSFPIEDDPAEAGELPVLLGDVVICPEVAWRNAPEHAGSYDDELALLLVHGILHLLGMDHVLTHEAERMEERERQLLARFHHPAR